MYLTVLMLLLDGVTICFLVWRTNLNKPSRAIVGCITLLKKMNYSTWMRSGVGFGSEVVCTVMKIASR